MKGVRRPYRVGPEYPGMEGKALLNDYLHSVVSTCHSELGDNLFALWSVGSLVGDDFLPDRSDLDLLAVSSGAVSQGAKDRLAQGLSHRSLPCPALGLDLLFYRFSEVTTVTRRPVYEFSFSSGDTWEEDVSFGGPYPGGLIDLSTARGIGRSLFGPPPQDVIGPISADWVLEELREGLRWHLEKIHHPFHDPTGSNAVLNACRAHHFHRDQEFVSKTEGARLFLEIRDVEIVRSALSSRARANLQPLDWAQVHAFVQSVLDDFD